MQKALLEGLYSLIAERELGYTSDQPPVTESLAANIECILAETEWAHRPSVSNSLDTARTVPVAGHLQLPARQWVGRQRPSRTGVLSW